MTSTIYDENRIRPEFVFANHNLFTYPTRDEERAFQQHLWHSVESKPEREQCFIVGCALMLLTGRGPNESLCLSWEAQADEHINLSTERYVKKYLLPSGAAKPIRSSFLYDTDQHLELPIPAFISRILRNCSQLKNRQHFCLSELLPPSWPTLWQKLYDLMPKQLLPKRRGHAFFHCWLSMALTELSDKEVAFALTGHSGFSSQHHLYYVTLEKQQLINVWSDAMTRIFGQLLHVPEDVVGYVGSPLLIRPRMVAEHFSSHYETFPVNERWQGYSKAKLIDCFNAITIEAYVALATNFALRRPAPEVLESVLSDTNKPWVTILDKNVDKLHPERNLPMSNITRAVVMQLSEIREFLRARWHIDIPQKGLFLLEPLTKQARPLSRVDINAVLFDGEHLPSNVFRHAMASLLRIHNAGRWGVTLLGHRPDKAHLPNKDILASCAEPNMIAAIEHIQRNEFGLQHRAANSSIPLSQMLPILVKQARWEDALALQLAFSLPRPILNKLTQYTAHIESRQGFHHLIVNDSFLDFLTDEQLALFNQVPSSRWQAAAKRAKSYALSPQQTSIGDRMWAHVQAYSSTNNFLSEACLTSWFSELPPLLPNQLKQYQSIIHKPMAPSLKRIKLLVDKLASHQHTAPEQIFQQHLLSIFSVINNRPNSTAELLNLVDIQLNNIEGAIYHYMYKKMVARKRNYARNIAGNTWRTEYGKVYKRMIDLMGSETNVSLLSEDILSAYYQKMQQCILTDGLNIQTKESMQAAIRGIFTCLGDENFQLPSGAKSKVKPQNKELVWPHQYRRLLHWITLQTSLGEADHLLYTCAAILMYKGGLRPNELCLLTADSISSSGETIRITSQNGYRAKSVKGNRVVMMAHNLTDVEQNQLQQLRSLLQKTVGLPPLFARVNVELLSFGLKTLTGNSNLSAYALRRSYANFHYLVVMDVHLPVLEVYFGRSIVIARAQLVADWCLRGYEDEAILKALSVSLGHANIATTMKYYICTLPIVRFYHNSQAQCLSQRTIAALLTIPLSTYRARVKTHPSGFPVGSLKILDTRHHSPLVTPLISSSTYNDTLVSQALGWLVKLTNSKEMDFRQALEREARCVGLNLKQTEFLLAKTPTHQWLTFLERLPNSTRSQIYEQWLSRVQPRGRLREPVRVIEFVQFMQALGWEYRVSAGKYVQIGQMKNRNGHIAAALCVMQSISLKT